MNHGNYGGRIVAGVDVFDVTTENLATLNFRSTHSGFILGDDVLDDGRVDLVNGFLEGRVVIGDVGDSGDIDGTSIVLKRSSTGVDNALLDALEVDFPFEHGEGVTIETHLNATVSGEE